MTFDAAFTRLLGHEGGYSNNPADPGGETMWGITKHVAIQHGYTGDMRYLSQETAKEIYRARYWDAVKADQFPDPLRYALFDAAVNSGPKQALIWAQQALDVGADGVVGDETLRAAMACDPQRVRARMLGIRLDFMTSLPIWTQFGKGWARRIAKELMA